MMDNKSKHIGWEVCSQRGPISKSLRIEYAKRPVLITGKNGAGKSSLLSLLMDQTSSSLVYNGIPKKVSRYWDLFIDSYDPSRLTESNLGEYRQRLLDRDPLLSGSKFSQGSDSPSLDLRVHETVIGPTHVEFRLNDLSQRFRLEMLPEDQTSTSNHGLNVLRWNRRADEVFADLAAETRRSFVRWFQVLADRTRGEFRPTVNPLAACKVESGLFISTLALADDWACKVAERASSRFELALGIGTRLRCSAPEDFSWEFQNGKNWLPVGEMSSGLRRCVALVLLDTLAEIEQHINDELPGSPIKFQLEGVPTGSFPHSSPQLFGGGRTWTALDEPELHLYPTEVRHFASAIANLKGAQNIVIATHSLEFLSSLYGRSEIHVFESPGKLKPPSETSPNQLLQRLVDHSPAVLAGLTLLYVEGDWDDKILGNIFGDRLGASGVLVKVLGGVVDSANTITSPAELIGRPSWVLFDGLSAATIQTEWEASIARILAGHSRDSEVIRLRGLANNPARYELVAMYKLLARTLERRIEGLVHLVSHDMGDITEVIHPRRWGFSHDNWDLCGFAGDNFKRFILQNSPVSRYTGPGDRASEQKFFAMLIHQALQKDNQDLWEPTRLQRLRGALAPLFVATGR
jgi:energy-coupling factor transporter ATP-binding protein EcfA2